MQTLLNNNAPKLDRPQPTATPRETIRAADDRFRNTLRSVTASRTTASAAGEKPSDQAVAVDAEPRDEEAVDAETTPDALQENPAKATEDAAPADAEPAADDEADQDREADVVAAEVAETAGVVAPRNDAVTVVEDEQPVAADDAAVEAETPGNAKPAAAPKPQVPAGENAQATGAAPAVAADGQPPAAADATSKPENASTSPDATMSAQDASAAASSKSDGDGESGQEKKQPAVAAMGQAKVSADQAAAAGAVEANKPAALAPATDAPADDQSAVRAMGPMRIAPAAAASPAGGTAPPESPRQLVEQGVDATVTAAKTMAAGGRQQQSMTLRLDPPQLGSMRVNVQMTDGQLTATFSAGSEVAHRLLQQNLPQLKAGLEQAGFNVDRLSVQRTPPAQPSQDGQFHQQQQNDGQPREQMQQHQRDQQRRETLIRMWRRGGFDGERTNLVA